MGTLDKQNTLAAVGRENNILNVFMYSKSYDCGEQHCAPTHGLDPPTVGARSASNLSLIGRHNSSDIDIFAE